MADIFLSYAREDEERVELLKRALEANGWSVSWDQQLSPGDRFRESIEELVAESLCVIVAWSRRSVTSDWVHAEAQRGLERRVLIPVLLDRDIRMPLPFDQLQAFPLYDWDGDPSSLDNRFVNAISRQAGPPALVRLLRRFEIRSTKKSEGIDLYDDICLVIESFGEKSCVVAKIVRDECELPAELSTSEMYNRYDVVPIIVMCDDALVELNHWYERIPPGRSGDESKLVGGLWAWIDQVLMVTSIIMNRLAESIEPSGQGYRFLLRVCMAVLEELKLEMREPPSEWALFHEARRGAEDVLLVLREADVQLMADSDAT